MENRSAVEKMMLKSIKFLELPIVRMQIDQDGLGSVLGPGVVCVCYVSFELTALVAKICEVQRLPQSCIIQIVIVDEESVVISMAPAVTNVQERSHIL